ARQIKQRCRYIHAAEWGPMDGLALLLALIALIVAFGARRGIAALQARLLGMKDDLRRLQAQVALSQTAPPGPPPAEPVPVGPVPSQEPTPVEKPSVSSEPVAAEQETRPAPLQPLASAA